MASQFVFDAIGTHWIIDISDEFNYEREKEILTRINDRIAIFDKAYSRFRDDSLVTAISKSAGRYILPDDAEEMLALYRKMYDITGGLVTPFIGQALVDAGYDAQYSLQQKNKLKTPPAWDDAITYNHPNIEVHIPVLLDFGAFGKGYLIDIVSRLLKDDGVQSFCVDAGGDMFYQNADDTPLSVGLEHPDDTTKMVGVASILNQSLCGSAGNRRVWGDFHHIINPETLSSPKHIRAVWAIAENTITADALTTALYFVSAQELAKHFTFEYFILFDDYSFKKSDGFKAEVFS